MGIKNFIISLLSATAAIIPIACRADNKYIDINNLYACEVKSVDEFISRFNGIETHPEIPNDSLSRVSNLFALFNHQEIFDTQNPELPVTMAKEFCDSVIAHNVTLSLTNGSMIAECPAMFQYKNKKYTLTLLLQQVVTDNGYVRWCISGVKGLETIIPQIESWRFTGISPVEHEIYFMGLSDYIPAGDAWSVKHPSSQPDQLSIFLTLVDSGALKLIQIKDETIHCIGVPGFVFTIHESPAQSNNSGWLMNRLERITSSQKADYITNLFHKL